MSVLTRKLWHSTRFVAEALVARGYPAIHKLYRSVGKAGFSLTEVVRARTDSGLFSGQT
jgi:hypothetical protein